VKVFHRLDEMRLAENEVDSFRLFDLDRGEVHGVASESIRLITSSNLLHSLTFNIYLGKDPRRYGCGVVR